MGIRVPGGFRSWITRSYWHFQGFFSGFAGVLVFFMVLAATRSVTGALFVGFAAALFGVVWSWWARRWGKFRDREPWE
jgi:hypothetical protein